MVICEDSSKPVDRKKKTMRRPLPSKLQIYSLNMSPYLVIHHPSLPNLGIRKQSRQAEEWVFIPSTTNLLPQDHDPITKHILSLSSHLQSGEKALPPLGKGGLYGAGLRSFRKKNATGCHYNSWTNYLFEAPVWASATKTLRVLLEKHKTKGVYSRISYLLTRLNTVSLAASSPLFTHRR